MTELVLKLDNQASKTLHDLMNHYRANKAEIIAKALGMLKIAALVDETQGELVARKGIKETKIRIR